MIRLATKEFFRLRMALLGLILMLPACAIDRSVIEPSVNKTVNPAQGVAVKVVNVEDLRDFQLAPSTPDIPSLKDGDITNKATTSRAMARKRNGYGQALGDVLLPENRNVADLTRGAVEQGFREAGYRVIEPGQPEYEQAAPVSVAVHQFWAWVTPGFWALTLEQKSELLLKGPLAQIQQGVTVNTYVKETPQMVPESTWRDIINKGLAELVAKVKDKLGGGKVATAE